MNKPSPGLTMKETKYFICNKLGILRTRLFKTSRNNTDAKALMVQEMLFMFFLTVV